MKRLLKNINAALKCWRQAAALYFKKALSAVLPITAIMVIAQLAGVWISLRAAEKLNWQTSSYDYATGNSTLVLWGPRLEELMSRGAWYPLSAAGYCLILLTLAVTPMRIAGGNKLGGTFRRMPVGGCAAAFGSIVSGFALAVFYWAAELGTLFGSELMYRLIVPAQTQIPKPAMIALLRWDVLNGLFPASRLWLAPLLLAVILMQVISVVCAGWNLAEGRESSRLEFAAVFLIILGSAFNYQITLYPLERWYFWGLPAAGALLWLRALIKQQNEPLF